jgi:hypothetical protein
LRIENVFNQHERQLIETSALSGEGIEGLKGLLGEEGFMIVEGEQITTPKDPELVGKDSKKKGCC